MKPTERHAEAPDEFRPFFTAHYDQIARYCLRRLPVDLAADATAETFGVAWRRRDRMPEGDAAIAWLYGVARNVVRNHSRARGRAVRLATKLAHARSQPVGSAESTVLRSAIDDSLQWALDQLNDADREIVRLRALEDLAPTQIAQVLGCSPGTARKRLTRATERLRRALDAQATEGAAE